MNNNIDTTFSVFYCLDTNVQSKIIFGPANLTAYAKAGSTDADVQWAQIPRTFDLDDQWLSQLSNVYLGSKGSIYDPSQKSVVIQADTGTTDLSIDPESYDNLLSMAAANGNPCAMEGIYLYCSC